MADDVSQSGAAPESGSTLPRWQWAATPAGEAENAATVVLLSDWIKADRRERVLAVLAEWPPVDALAMFTKLSSKRARKLFGWLPDDLGLRVLSEIDPRLQVILTQRETRQRFAKLLQRLKPQQILRLLAELPDELAAALIAEREDAYKLSRQLKKYKDTAASAMRSGVLAVPETWLIDQVISDIRARSAEIEKLDAMYVVDEEHRLKGYLRMRDLLLCPRDALVADILHTDLVSVDADEDQERVLRLAKQRNLSVIAVKDRDGKLLGCVTQRELAQIVRDEAEEDMLLMGGVSPDSTVDDTPLQIVRRRVPWLVGGLLGASVAATVIGSYEDALAKAAILASFIPVVMATAGNAGIQASTVSIQALTSGTMWSGDIWARLAREFVGAAMNGALIGIAVGAMVLLVAQFVPIDRPGMLSATVLVALITVTIIASTVGAAVPAVLDKLGLDPAVATGIFITTSNDVFGVLIFFTVASLLYF